jgi:hypothetical protein
MAWVMATAAGKRLVPFRGCGMRNADIFRDFRCGLREARHFNPGRTAYRRPFGSSRLRFHRVVVNVNRARGAAESGFSVMERI